MNGFRVQEKESTLCSTPLPDHPKGASELNPCTRTSVPPNADTRPVPNSDRPSAEDDTVVNRSLQMLYIPGIP